MAKTVQPEAVSMDWSLINWRALVSVAITGAIVGIAGLALYYMLDRYVFEQIFCRPDVPVGKCEDRQLYASGVAMVLAGAGALFSLIQQRVYRSLLVVLAVTVALWNIFLMIVSLPWLLMVLLTALIFAVAYAAFTWIAQLRNLVVTVVMVIVLVVLTRLILLS